MSTAALTVGSDAIQWNMLWGILGSWFITPVMSGILAYLLFMSVQIAIFRHYHPLEHAKRIAPLYIAVTFFTLSIITIKSGLKHIGIELSNQNSIYVALGISVLTALIGKFFINRIKFEKNIKRKHYVNVEKVFTVLMIVTACAMAFAHGSNDVANAIGPLSAVVASVQNGTDITSSTGNTQEWWILPLGALGIVIGLATLGYKVMKTVGVKITQLTPSHYRSNRICNRFTNINNTDIGRCYYRCRSCKRYCGNQSNGNKKYIFIMDYYITIGCNIGYSILQTALAYLRVIA